jgi:hypothetical protein
VTTPNERPGTYRVDDGSKVAFTDAIAAWIPLAYDELISLQGSTAPLSHTLS